MTKKGFERRPPPPPQPPPEDPNAVTTCDGVRIIGYNTPGRIENTNPFPVRVEIEGLIKLGDTSIWGPIVCFDVAPGGVSERPIVKPQNVYRVFRKDTGVSLGFKRPSLNGKG